MGQIFILAAVLFQIVFVRFFLQCWGGRFCIFVGGLLQLEGAAAHDQVFVDGKALWLLDTGHRRVLIELILAGFRICLLGQIFLILLRGCHAHSRDVLQVHVA